MMVGKVRREAIKEEIEKTIRTVTNKAIKEEVAVDNHREKKVNSKKSEP